MTGKERTIRFIRGEAVDRVPFHPLVMQYAATKTGVPFGQYCLNPQMQVKAMLGFAQNFGMDTVHPSGFPYCEAGAYGLPVCYPEDNLPYHTAYLIQDFERDIHLIRPLDIQANPAMMNRVEGVATYVRLAGEALFIRGHCEGPLAEYCDLRGMSNAFMDFYDYPDEVHQALRILVDNAKAWIALQVQAGCHCMSIGDAACSQISEEMYREFVLPYHRELVAYIHALGVFSQLHICGNTQHIIPHLIQAGTSIVDVDHLVPNMERFIPLLGRNQVLSGNLDPVSVIRNGTPDSIHQAVQEQMARMGRYCMMSAGCEIPKDTPEENYHAFYEATCQPMR